MAAAALMRVAAVKAAEVTYPTGNKAFSVLQAFPAAFPNVSPFLMLDHFGPTPSKGPLGEDEFDVPWHPHRGQDLLTYIIDGKGRHADSMGNRETFDSPGIQWISAGSGIEHAEGGGNDKGVVLQGFQIWVDVPAAHKMDAPRYGTHAGAELPLADLGAGATARVLAGALGGAAGPFKTRARVMIADVRAPPGATAAFDVDAAHDEAVAYVFDGAGTLNGRAVARGQAARLDAAAPGGARRVELAGGAGGVGVRALVFTGASLAQPVAWHGPFVMTTDAEIRATIDDYRRGTFLKVRAPFDYKSAAAGREWAAAEAKKAGAAGEL